MLSEYGVDLKTGIAGFCGGLFALLVVKDLTVKQKIASLIGGLLAASYCTKLIMHLLSVPAEFTGGMGFAVGVFGMAIIGKVLIAINSLTINDMKELTVDWIKAVVSPLIEALRGKK